MAVDENSKILDIVPQSIHQRSAFYIGNSDMVTELLLEYKPGFKATDAPMK
jgi:fructose-1,6-bisphosphatase